jgi:two-component system cell cycle response regulator DivK
MPGELVLIVEDNERNLKLARDVLQFKGFVPSRRARPAMGLQRPYHICQTFVLMDIQLPDMDGAAALQRLRADPATAAIRVVALTAFAMREDRERLMAAGFDAYIAKPIDVKQFPVQVQEQCNLARAAREEARA